MLLSRMKIKDGRITIRDAKIIEIDTGRWDGLIKIIDGTHIALSIDGGKSWSLALHFNQVSDDIIAALKSKGLVRGNFFVADSTKDSITEGSKIVVNTENHVNENAIAVSVNEDNCLVRFENGDEETIPIEAVSAFESTANDASAPKDFFDLDEWKIKAKSLGYIVENNSQRGLWVARVGIREMGTYNPLKGGTLYTDQSSTETESQIAELTKNMDAARTRGYDISAYQKEIARLKSMDGGNTFAVVQSGGSVGEQSGEQYQGKKIIKKGFTTLEEAKAFASRWNAMLSPGEKSYYKIKYSAVEMKDKYTGDPLTEKGKEIMASLKEQYGEEKGEQVFYAMKNSGQIKGIDSEDGGPGSGVKGHTTAESPSLVESFKGYKIYKSAIGLRAVPIGGGPALEDIREGGGDMIELKKKISRATRGYKPQ